MLLWCDGFDHYGLDESLMLAWTLGADADLSAARARTGARGLEFNGGANASAARGFGAAKTIVGAGHCFFLDALPSANNRTTLLEFRDAAAASQIAVAVMTDGRIKLTRGDATGTLIATSDEAVTPGMWNHIEARVAMNQTAGSVEVRLNGATIIHRAAIDTCATANVEASSVAVRNVANPGSAWGIDDIFAWDLAGSFNTDFLGDKRVFALRPSADTVIGDFTPNAGAGYAAIADDGQDGDTSYIEATTAGDISEFRFEKPDRGISCVAAAVAVACARKDDTGSSTLKATLVSGVTVAGSVAHSLADTYALKETVLETNPATAAPWTRDELSSALLRFERVS